VRKGESSLCKGGGGKRIRSKKREGGGEKAAMSECQRKRYSIYKEKRRRKIADRPAREGGAKKEEARLVPSGSNLDKNADSLVILNTCKKYCRWKKDKVHFEVVKKKPLFTSGEGT